MLFFQVFGPFSLTDENGVDLRPKLMKSRAILAVLAATPGHRHSRCWFQTLLWEDRQPEQAQSSLRSALADIRRHLGENADALISDHYDIALDPSRIDIAKPRRVGAEDFLAGFDIRHSPGFEEWLREARAQRGQGQSATPTFSREWKRSLLESQAGTSDFVPDDCNTTKIFLGNSFSAENSVTQMLCDTLVDSVSRLLIEFGVATVLDGRANYDHLPPDRAALNSCDFWFLSDSMESSEGSISRLRLIDRSKGKLVWSKSLFGKPNLDLDAPAHVATPLEVFDILLGCIQGSNQFKADDRSPSPFNAAAIDHILSADPLSFEVADALFGSPKQGAPQAVHLAWRGLMRCLSDAKTADQNSAFFGQSALSFSRRALELDPHSSIVLSFASITELFFANDFQLAKDLALRSCNVNRSNPVAWAALAKVHLANGDASNATETMNTAGAISLGTRFSRLIGRIAELDFRHFNEDGQTALPEGARSLDGRRNGRAIASTVVEPALRNATILVPST